MVDERKYKAESFLIGLVIVIKKLWEKRAAKVD